MHRRDLLKGLSLMLGGSISTACSQALSVPPSRREISAQGYSVVQREIAHICADLIMPETDTPGALDAGVGDFIDYVVAVWYRPEELEQFLGGLDRLQAQSLRNHGKAFAALTEQEQAVLLQAEESAGDPAEAFGSGDYFSQIKELTVVGYYTSEVGSKEERSYIPMPGRYDGYHKIAAGDRQWSS